VIVDGSMRCPDQAGRISFAERFDAIPRRTAAAADRPLGHSAPSRGAVSWRILLASSRLLLLLRLRLCLLSRISSSTSQKKRLISRSSPGRDVLRTDRSRHLTARRPRGPCADDLTAIHPRLWSSSRPPLDAHS
jgi:hypothetical protein